MIVQMDLGMGIMGSFVRGQGELGMRIVLCPSPAYSNALKKTFESLDRGLAGLGLQPRPPLCMLFTIRPLTLPLTLLLEGLDVAREDGMWNSFRHLNQD